MRRVLALVLSIFMMSTGCSQVHQVYVTDDPAALDEVDRFLREGSSTVHLKDGTSIRAQQVSLTPDCTSITSASPAVDSMVLPTWRIDRIGRTSHARGALEGGLAGLLAGIVFGVILGAASYSEDQSGFLVSSRGDAMGFAGVYFGAIGLGGGLVAGALAGHREEYAVQAMAGSTTCE